MATGYARLATEIQLRPETAIFRRFGALNAQNLLYYQSQLTSLEIELRQHQDQRRQDCMNNNNEGNEYTLSWFKLESTEHTGDTKQLELVLKIREILSQYSMSYTLVEGSIIDRQVDAALVHQSQILAFPQPERWDMTRMQNFIFKHVSSVSPLTGDDADVWGSVSGRKDHSVDLVSLCPRPKEDFFSGWLAENALSQLVCCGCARLMKVSYKYGAIGYEDATIFKITYWVTNIIASLIPIASILALYFVHSMAARLGIIAGFNVLLSLCLSAFTTAKRSDVFAVTAASVLSPDVKSQLKVFRFAAVQVVFVSAERDRCTNQ